MVWEQGIAIIAMVTAEEVSTRCSYLIFSASTEKLMLIMWDPDL